MEIASTQNTPLTAPAAASATDISSDFETFLKMLTVQMQNQDPLNPVDSSDYAVQLATFSGVEQQVQTNDLLRALVSQIGGGGMAQMADWVGKEGLAPTAASFEGTPITISAAIKNGANGAQVVVRNSSDTEVGRFEIPAIDGMVEWDGMDNNGNPHPQGDYSFEVISFDDDQVLSVQQARTFSEITEIRQIDGVVSVILGGGVEILASDVAAIRAPN